MENNLKDQHYKNMGIRQKQAKDTTHMSLLTMLQTYLAAKLPEKSIIFVKSFMTYVINMRMRKGSLLRIQSSNLGWIKRIILSLQMKYSHPTQAVSGASRIIRSVCLPKAMTNSLFATGCSATRSAAQSSMITFRTQS